ncbi:hypothetical protein POTOM_045010 [Populus tomentosa]|uniref:Mitochondrial Rho GTPase n=1 Tax=Populus tomentosa TaxID=118781 RepID=A0A8X8CCP8_POPTO|nr:hypothetical protein POTOM_045010 [Populus tomentosa]
MARAAAAANPGVKSGVRIVVAGDRGTGKSSLIVTAISDTFPSSIPPVLPPTRMPDDFYPDRVPITIIDTSSKVEDAGKVAEELKRADAVVLTYACDRPETLDRLSTFWLPELRQLEVKVPVIVVGCKLDLRDENQQVSLEQVMSPIMQQFREIETCIECSAFKHIQIPEVFYYAQKAVLHPTGPLFDQESQTLKPRCVRALKRIFILCDLDRDGALNVCYAVNDVMANWHILLVLGFLKVLIVLKFYQVKCFNAPLQPSEIVGVKKVVEEKLPGGGVNDRGVNERGLTLTGFLFLHALFIEKGRLETTWTVLRKFGYNNDIKLTDELIPSFKRAPDQSAELTSEAAEYLRNIYELFDSDGDNNLRPAELEDIFSTAPESPWEEPPYKDAAEKTALSGLSVNAFLSEVSLSLFPSLPLPLCVCERERVRLAFLFSFCTILFRVSHAYPSRAVENLIYIGYSGDPTAAVRLTRRRRLDRKKQQSDRNVFHCFVFGPKKSGKSALVNSFIGRPFYDNYAPTTEESYAVHVVDLPGVIKKTLVLREIPEDGVKKLLLNKEALAPCDIAVFVYDSSDQSSWKRATELLVEVAGHGEDTGYEVPCLIVAAKDDLNSFPMAIQESTRVSQDMGIEAPIPISSKMGDTNNVFRRIVTAAEHPHLSIPETEAGRSRKQYNRLINRSLMFVSDQETFTFHHDSSHLCLAGLLRGHELGLAWTFCAYTSNPGIIGIVITPARLSGFYHDACDQKTVCIQGGKIGIRLLKELVDVYIGNNKARSTAPRVLEYAFDVLSNAQDAISTSTRGVPEPPLLDSSDRPKAIKVSDSAAILLSTRLESKLQICILALVKIVEGSTISELASLSENYSDKNIAIAKTRDIDEVHLFPSYSFLSDKVYMEHTDVTLAIKDSIPSGPTGTWDNYSSLYIAALQKFLKDKQQKRNTDSLSCAEVHTCAAHK